MIFYMKTKKALAGLLGLLGSLAAALLAFVGFLFTESLTTTKDYQLIKRFKDNTNTIQIQEELTRRQKIRKNRCIELRLTWSFWSQTSNYLLSWPMILQVKKSLDQLTKRKRNRNLTITEIDMQKIERESRYNTRKLP